MENYRLVIDNQKVFEFYQKNTNLNFEQVNLLSIGLFENILQNANTTENNLITTQILNECLKNNHKLDQLATKVEKLNCDLLIKLFDIKKDYIEEVKNIINNNGIEKIDKINVQLREYNSQVIDKITINHFEHIQKIENKNTLYNSEITNKIHEQINITNTNFFQQFQLLLNTTFNDKIQQVVQDQIDKFYIILNQETKKITDYSINYNQKQDTIIAELTQKNTITNFEIFVNSIDEKFNSLLRNIQQPIIEATTKQQVGQDRMFNSLEEFLDRYRNNSSFKGKIAENHLKLILEENIENAEIIDKSHTPHSGDLLLRRNNKDNIIIENKSYTHKVPTSEIEKFKFDCIKEKTHGIFISQFSKITFKNNYQIEIEEDNDHNKIILIYVADVKDDFIKIQIAINIIDILAEKVKNNYIVENNIHFNMQKEILDEINHEFNTVIIQKQNILLLIKEFQKKITISLDEIKLPTLKKYLESKIQQTTTTTTTFECTRCKKFNAKNKSALVAHQKSKECNKIFAQQILLEGGQQIPQIQDN